MKSIAAGSNPAENFAHGLTGLWEERICRERIWRECGVLSSGSPAWRRRGGGRESSPRESSPRPSAPALCRGPELRTGRELRSPDLRGVKLRGVEIRRVEVRGVEIRRVEGRGAEVRREEGRGAVLRDPAPRVAEVRRGGGLEYGAGFSAGVESGSALGESS